MSYIRKIKQVLLGSIVVICVIVFSGLPAFGLSPQTNLKNDEFRSLFQNVLGIAFPNQESWNIFARWVNDNQQVIPLRMSREKLDGKPYRILSEEPSGTRFLFADDITYQELLKFEEDYRKVMKNSLWTQKGDHPSVRELLVSTLTVLADRETIAALTQNNDMVTLSFELAIHLYPVVFPEAARTQTKETIAKLLEKYVQISKFNRESHAEKIKQARAFLLDQTLFSFSPAYIQSLIKQQKMELFKTLINKYNQLLVPKITNAADLSFFESGIVNLDRLKLPSEFFEREKTLKEMLQFAKWKKTSFDSVNESELFGRLLNLLKLYIGKQTYSVSDILSEKSIKCSGATLLAGKILSELGFNVYCLNVFENSANIYNEGHVALLVTKKDGTYLVFDPAIPSATKTIYLSEKTINRIDQGEVADVRLPIEFKTHKRFQIVPFLEGIQSTFYNNLGLQALRDRQYDKAIAYYNKSLQLHAQNPTALSGAGVAYQQKDDFQTAIQFYVQSLGIHRKDPKTLGYLGKAYFYIGKDNENKDLEIEKAVAFYKEALQIDPSPITWENLGEVYEYLGAAQLPNAMYCYTQAVNAFSKIDGLVQTKTKTWTGLVRCYLAQGNLDMALNASLQLLKIDPMNQEAYLNLFKVYSQRNQPDLARQMLQKAYAIDSTEGKKRAIGLQQMCLSAA